ncbi:ATP-grasp fold amidoligase family protein [Solibacillus daqui]|uniref:ATP-grasp fold amidoligase family protein n=1 Tax=Solibacillus daqui TaxID=2912187 RepID=UPI002366BFC8|nr:ATP-grasp fold amidoligase family protein [Solibacillus daqui]
MKLPIQAKRYAFSQIVKLSPIVGSKLLFWKTFKYRLNLENPQTFTEKLMWLKLFEDVEFKRRFTDKVKAREYMITLGYSHLLVPTIGIFDEVDDIIFEQLPRKFVLKCSHGARLTIVCENKREMDYRQTRLQLAEMMAMDYSLEHAEPHYAMIHPRIIIEHFIEPSTSNVSNEYKIHCFHGEPKLIEATVDCSIPKQQTLMLTSDWQNTDYMKKKSSHDEAIAKPEQLEELLAIAKKLSKPFTYVRVDLKIVDEKIYFNNFTFSPEACLYVNIHEEANQKLGQWLELDIGKTKQQVSYARSK